MNKYSIFIVLNLLLSACTNNDLGIPKKYEYGNSTFEGEIMTYNSSGKLLNSISPFYQDEFLDDKKYGIYPIDKIVLNPENHAQFFTSRNQTSVILEGDYLISNDKITLDVYFSNDTLKLFADYSLNKLSIEAYGFKIYSNVGTSNSSISTAHDFGLVEISKLLRYVKPTDTLCVQRFYENYELK